MGKLKPFFARTLYGRIATEDLAAALSYILRNAGSLGGDEGLFTVGQLRWREDRRGDRFAWHRTVRRRGLAEAIGRRSLVHRSFGSGVSAGGQAEMLAPPDRGIRGNSHMIMQDKNNLPIADLVLRWIAERVSKR
jgi:hypothetical protein